ncbi:MAG: hypothetical protein EBR32_05980 [Bacteroidetes bacterium]|nr:hypothetical protein [Bacteroidota bacterium]
MKSRITNTDDRYDLLHAYLKDSLSEADEEKLWELLIRDGELYEDLLHLANLKQVLAKQAEPTKIQAENPGFENTSKPILRNAKSVQSKVFFPIWRPVTAVLVTFIVVIGIFWINENKAIELTSNQPLQELPLDIYRGGEEISSQGVFDDIEASAARGNFEEALSLINEQLEFELTAQERHILLLNQGVYRYNLSRHPEAISSFLILQDLLEDKNNQPEESDSVSDRVMLEKTKWYLAQSYYQVNNISKAIDYFDQVVLLNGSYQRIATNYASFLRNNRPQNNPNSIIEDK